MIQPLAEFGDPEGRDLYEKRIMAHCDNVMIHNAEAVQECLTDDGFIRINYPADGRDILECIKYMICI
jgi:hypothetical protein